MSKWRVPKTGSVEKCWYLIWQHSNIHSPECMERRFWKRLCCSISFSICQISIKSMPFLLHDSSI
jgi:hypothetical protein